MDSVTRHIFLIDPLEKLTVKKDSSLMLALSLQEAGREVSVLYLEDLAYLNWGECRLRTHFFSAAWEGGGPYLKNFSLEEEREIVPGAEDVIHLRLDPPFDTRYLRTLWLLAALSRSCGVRVLNRPEGVLLNNEKIAAARHTGAMETLVGGSPRAFLRFARRQKNLSRESLIFKPVDAYQGMGVERVPLALKESELARAFEKKRDALGGAFMVQPFEEKVREGEVRALYYDGVELASILKIPSAGSFLSTIARGASFEKATLSKLQQERCTSLARNLAESGTPFVAFDVLGDSIQEANITCPGLLVEASAAWGVNLAEKMIELM